MYYKLPVKERMELMKSYRKANPDMSYQDMVKDYNSSYEKFNNGGKKEINLNLKNQESNTPLSTWNQNTDWLGEKYNDVGLNFNKNNLNIGIGNYVPRSTFEKVGNINPYLNVNYNLNDKSSIGGSFSKDYNGISFIQKFGNGGKKEVTKTVVYTDKAAFDKAYKAEKDSLNAFNNDKKWESFLKNTPSNFYNYDQLYKLYENARKKGTSDKYWGLAVREPSGAVKTDLDVSISSKDGKYVAGYSPVYKKPVIHNIYEPPVEPIQDTIKPAIKDTVKQKPIVNNVDSVLTKHWNFNGPNPVMEYYDKSGKLINKEYYDRVNGKKIQPLTK